MSQWIYFDGCHRNRTSWEVIDGEAQQVLKGRSASGSSDHPIKTYTYTWVAHLIRAPALKVGDPGSNPGTGKNFFS